MQILRFNFSKISAERFPDFKGKPKITTNVDFSNFDKQKNDLIKDQEIYKIDFKLVINYSDQEEKESGKDKKSPSKLGEVTFQGHTLIGLSKDDPKDILKSFKKNEIPITVREFFLNLILSKCAAKALDLEDQIHLPYHIPLPKVKLQEKKD
jgi:hypothetical protein